MTKYSVIARRVSVSEHNEAINAFRHCEIRRSRILAIHPYRHTERSEVSKAHESKL